MTKPCMCWNMFMSYASRNWHQLLSWVCARMGNLLCIFVGKHLLKLVDWYFGFSYIYRTKFDAFSDIDNFSIISRFPFFDIDKLPISSEKQIYRRSIIFHRYIVHPYREVLQNPRCSFILKVHTKMIHSVLKNTDLSAFDNFSSVYRPPLLETRWAEGLEMNLTFSLIKFLPTYYSLHPTLFFWTPERNSLFRI